MANIAREGAPKNAQTSFPVHDMMKDAIDYAPAAPTNAGSGPDASAASPLDIEPRGKLLKKQPGVVAPAWDMRDGDGDSVDPEIGGDVLAEGKLTGRA